MFPFTTLLTPLSIALSLSTATGVLLHDTKLDKAASLAPALSAGLDAADRSIKLAGDPHTHAERGSLSQAVRDIKSQNPRVQPRTTEDKKHLMQKNAPRGYHSFDSYNTPLI
ncbi:hypothetical protein D3C85_220780 [compost metagenome]|jgi:hypothetical protein